MEKNMNLINAKKKKDDEFYTLFEDIERELENYRFFFRNKTVYLNCDNPARSGFWRYFHLKFSRLKLRKLICTHIAEEGAEAACYEYSGGNDAEADYYSMIKELKEGGGFQSGECTELLKEADIIVTNPPWSLMRDYISLIDEYGKKYIIVGNINAILYKEVFRIFQAGRLQTGFTSPKAFLKKDGTMQGFGNAVWFTSLPVAKKTKPLNPKKIYYGNEDLYMKYDNYDAINVDRVEDIPYDYVPSATCNGIMGVPVSFLMSGYTPEKYEITGAGTSREFFEPSKKYLNPVRHNKDGTTTKKHIAVNQTLTLGYDKKPENKIYITADNSDKYLVSPYNRILIRRKMRRSTTHHLKSDDF